MRYSIVMPVYLREEAHKSVVLQTLENIHSTKGNAELIVIDDGSTLPTGFVREYADTYVRQPNQGISRAWNVGKWLARGDFVAIVNDDIVVPDGWLDALAEPFLKERCAVSAPMEGGPAVVPEITQIVPYTNHKFYPGYCFMLSRHGYYRDFDPYFDTNCGDVDYWHTIKSVGLELYRAPLKIWHKEGDVLHGMNYQALTQTSIEKFIEKWHFNPQSEYYA